MDDERAIRPRSCVCTRRTETHMVANLLRRASSGRESSSRSLQQEDGDVEPDEELDDDVNGEDQATLGDVLAERKREAGEEHVVESEEGARGEEDELCEL